MSSCRYCPHRSHNRLVPAARLIPVTASIDPAAGDQNNTQPGRLRGSQVDRPSRKVSKDGWVLTKPLPLKVSPMLAAAGDP